MTIDKQKLKALALVATKSKWTTDDLNEVMSAESDQLNSGFIIADCQGPDRWRNAQYIAAACPATVLDLLAEIEALESRVSILQKYEDECLHLMREAEAERDQLKAENEALRKDAERYRWLCEAFGVTKLPCAVERILAGEVYVADGKSGVDVAIDAAMAKEASHG